MTITTEFVGFVIGILGFVTTVWVRIESIVNRARAEAMASAASANARAEILGSELAAYKLHVSETYVSKTGLREQMDRLMGAIGGLHDQLGNMSDRIDRVIERQEPPPRAARRGSAS